MTDKMELAKQFMEQAHFDQERWDGRPYSTHPIKVVEILERMNIGSIDILCAGYLHDVLEDTITSKKDIKDKFGEEVADLVDELTFKQGGTDYYYWMKCSILSPEAKLIKIADILANIGDKGRKSEHFIQKRVKALEILLRGTLK